MRVAPINIVDTLFHSALSVERSYEFDTYKFFRLRTLGRIYYIYQFSYCAHTYTLTHSLILFYFIQFSIQFCECALVFDSVLFIIFSFRSFYIDIKKDERKKKNLYSVNVHTRKRDKETKNIMKTVNEHQRRF